MAKIKMSYKEMAKRITVFCFKDCTLDKDAQAFQRFVEIMVLPAGTKQYTDEMFKVYVLEALENQDYAKQKDEQQLKRVETDLEKENKKSVEQKPVEQKPVEQRPELETAGYKPLKEGYQPTHNRLDTSKPPQGGSGVPQKNIKVNGEETK